MSSLATVRHILPMTTILRERTLPVAGRVLARAGQKVNPRDVIADAILAPEHLIFDIVRALRVPAKNVEKYLQRNAGETISAGDVIAQGPRGFTQRIVRAPYDGKIAAIEHGKIILQRDLPPFELIAGYTGTVADLIEGRGVIIETVGALVQGVWGNERVDSGLMRTLAAQPDSVLKPKDLNVNTRGAFILSGHVEDPETLKVAMDVPIRGLILASMPPALIELARKMPYPILLTEGFGKLPMNSAAFTLLSTNQDRDVTVNAQSINFYKGRCPEVLINLPISGQAPAPPLPKAFAPGQLVRVVREPYAAQCGTIQSILPGLSVLPNQLRAACARVELEDKQQVIIPLVNLEVLR